MPTKPKPDRPHMPGYGVSKSKKGMLPFTYFQKLFGANRNYFIATATPDGAPHVMPVWGVWHSARFYFSTGSSTRKANNLADNPRCAITAEDGARPLILEGVASQLAEADGFKAAATPTRRSMTGPLRSTWVTFTR